MASNADFIRERAQKYDFHEIARRLEASLDAVGAHLNGLRQDQADFKPDASEWSVGEIIHHVIGSTSGMIRVADKLNQNQPFKRPMEQSDMGLTQSGVPVATLRANWEALRQDLRAKLAALTPPLRTDVTRAHAAFGPLHAIEWLVLSYLHNRRHQAQIERVKAAVGFPK